jgi:hypothetical protein
MNDLLEWLQHIYADDLSSGSWEHEHGIDISTLDNPGWYFKFDLRDTVFEDFPFDAIIVEVDDNNWYECKFENNVFIGMGGAKNLINILVIFKEWYQQAEKIIDGEEKKE